MDQSISQLPIEDIEKAIRVMREVEKSGTMDEIRLKSNDLNMKYISNQTIKRPSRILSDMFRRYQ